MSYRIMKHPYYKKLKENNNQPCIKDPETFSIIKSKNTGRKAGVVMGGKGEREGR